MVNSLIKTAFAGLLASCSLVSAECTQPRARKNWTAMSREEKAAFIQAEQCLMDPERSPSRTGLAGSQSIWEDFQVVHTSQVQIIHRTGAFLPWHRYFLKIHLDLLEELCDYTGPFPYWDLQADIAAGSIFEASIWDSDPEVGLGSTASNSSEGNCVVDGAMSGITTNLNSDLSRQPERGCLTRGPFNETWWSRAGQDSVDACNVLDNYSEFNMCLFKLPHKGGHFSVGGIMTDISLSPADPLFFIHHTNVDRLWWQWQSQDLPARLTDMGGENIGNSAGLAAAQPVDVFPLDSLVPYFDDDGDQTTLNHVLWYGGLAENATIADAMDPNSDTICATFE